MAVKAVSGDSVTLAVGDVWVIDVEVTDLDAFTADDPPAVTITLPDGGTASPVVEDLRAGRYRTTYAVGAAGRYVARAVTAVNGVAEFTAWVDTVTAAADMPTADDLDDYMGGAGQHSWTVEDLQQALDIEAANQRRVCRIPAAYTADLRGALLRRAERHLALRRAQPTVVEDGPTFARQIGRDSEVRRYEAPYRRLPIA